MFVQVRVCKTCFDEPQKKHAQITKDIAVGIREGSQSTVPKDFMPMPFVPVVHKSIVPNEHNLVPKILVSKANLGLGSGCLDMA